MTGARSFLRSSSFVGWVVAGLVCVALGASACGNEDATVRPRLNGTGETDGGELEAGALGCGVVVPEAYVAPAFAANANVELAFATSLAELDAKMASTEGDATATVTGAELAALYNGGAPSLRAVSTTTSQGLIDTYLADFGAAQGKTWQPSDAQADGGAETGGKLKGLFYESRTGLDLRAATSKTILGGALYNHALGLVAQGVTDPVVDRLLALYGASLSLAGRTDVDAGADGDRLVAELASKRDDKAQPTGVYRRIRRALLTMKAAVTNLPACQPELDAAVAEYRLGWEQATYASAIFSLNAAAASAVNPDSAALTLHAYGDAVGLIQSFKGLPIDKRKITDAQIDLILGQIHAETPYGAVTDPGTRILDLTSAINSIAAFEGFDPTQVESFKKSF